MAYTMTLKALALLMTFIPLMMVSGLSVQIGDSAITADYAMGGAIVFKGRIQVVEVELSGTVQEMYAEFAKMYSDVVANATAAHKNLDTRNSNVSSKDHYCCPIGGQPNWQGADAGRIDQGITYLDNFQGVCNTGGGPGNCVRISCSYGTGIYLCNDNADDLIITCGDVAYYAEQIIYNCQWFDPNQIIWYTCRQWFDNGNWNVIVHSGRC